MGFRIATLLVVASCGAPATASALPAEPARAGRADRRDVYVQTIIARDTLVALSRTLLAELAAPLSTLAGFLVAV